MAPAKPAAAQPPAKPAAAAAAAAGAAQPTLLGQYGDWGAYAASPGGSKVCFALAKPKTTKTEPAGRKRDPSYIFVSTRPAENVKNEVSVIIGYPFKTSSDATAEVGAAKFAMYTQNDGAWIKNVAEEARMVDAMRKGADLTVKGTSGRGHGVDRPVFAQGARAGARQDRAGVQVGLDVSSRSVYASMDSGLRRALRL